MLRQPEPDYEMHIKPYKPEKPAQAPEWWSEPPEPKQQPEQKQVEEVLNQSEPTQLDNLELELKPEAILEPVEKRPVDSEPKKATDSEPLY